MEELLLFGRASVAGERFSFQPHWVLFMLYHRITQQENSECIFGEDLLSQAAESQATRQCPIPPVGAKHLLRAPGFRSPWKPVCGPGSGMATGPIVGSFQPQAPNQSPKLLRASR